MLWRSLVIFVTCFWLVMAVLLLRVTYFPEDSRFAQMPPGAVWKLFLDRGASGKQLHLYHGEKKIGHTTLDLRRMHGLPDSKDFTLLLSGMLEAGALPGFAGSLNWRLNIDLREGERWAGAGGQFRLPEKGVVVDFKWREDQRVPEVIVHQGGLLQPNSDLLQALLGQLAAGPGTNARSTGTEHENSLKVSAREGAKPIAGQNRKGYVIEFRVMDQYRASAFFTEEGDLALIELPDGYRALEPNIHGLVPDEPDEPS